MMAALDLYFQVSKRCSPAQAGPREQDRLPSLLLSSGSGVLQKHQGSFLKDRDAKNMALRPRHRVHDPHHTLTCALSP